MQQSIRFLKIAIMGCLFALTSSSFASTLNQIQGHWTRYGVRCAGSSEIWNGSSDVTFDFPGNELVSKSAIGNGLFAETDGQIVPLSDAKTLRFRLNNVVERPYQNFYDFMDNKTSLKLSLSLSKISGIETLVLGNVTVDAKANGCAKYLEFLYAR